MTYSFDSTNSAQSVDLFLKAGIYSRNGSITLYYPPLTNEFGSDVKCEIFSFQ
ncbi:MAG: hypothetical protein J7K51_05070 [Thermotogae bacterium]|nr:hypothetical protein [Thermotogota bacterium]